MATLNDEMTTHYFINNLIPRVECCSNLREPSDTAQQPYHNQQGTIKDNI